MAFDTKPNLNDQKFEQFSGETLSLSGCTDIYGDFVVKEEGILMIASGASVGYVLTSDDTGIASWQAENIYTNPISGYTCDTNDSVSIGYGAMPYATSSGGSGNVAVGQIALASAVDGACNVALGYSAMYNSTGGTYNIGIGQSALDVVDGTENVGIGRYAACSVTTGDRNIALGGSSLRSNTIGECNIALGYQSLFTNTTGSHNIALGACSLTKNIAGGNNLAIGLYSMCAVTGGSNQIAIGPNSMRNATCGYSNVAVGVNTLRYNTTGQYNIALGDSALYCNGVGFCNIAIGPTALNQNTTGCDNIALGTQAMFSNEVGHCNVAIGKCTMQAASGGTKNLAIGLSALNFNEIGDDNTAIGEWALYNNTTGSANLSIGRFTSTDNVTGIRNVSLGYFSLRHNVGGGRNIAIGDTTMCANVGGNENIALGYQTMHFATGGTGNIAFGTRALRSDPSPNTGCYNFAVGQNTMYYNTTGSYNVALGYNAFQSNTEADYNVAIGYASLYYLTGTTSSCNIAIGWNAVSQKRGGCRLIGIGPEALVGSFSDLTTHACDVVAIGYRSQFCSSSGKNNVSIGTQSLQCNFNGGGNIALGSFAAMFSTGSTNQIALGCNALRCHSCGVGCNVAIGGNSQLYNESGKCNVAVGGGSFTRNIAGCNNTAIGHCAGAQPTGSSNSVFIGFCTAGGIDATTVSDSVFIGYRAGYSESGSSRLHIANNQNCSLIYGEFDNKLVCIDKKLSTCHLQVTSGASEGYVLTSDSVGNAIWTAGGGGTATSGENVTKEVVQASHGFAIKDFVGWSGGTYNKAIADGNYDGEFVGIVTASADTNTFSVTQSGYITGMTGLVANTTYWLSPDTAGLITSTEPSVDGEVSKAILVANSTTSAWVLPYAGFMVSSGATALSTADNGLTDNSGIVELGGTLCRNTDIDVSGFNLSISGLSGKTTQEKAIFVDDVTGTLITGATTAGCGDYSSNSPATCTVGGISAGTILTGNTLEYLLQEILAPYIEPTFSSFLMTQTSPMEVGAALSGSKPFSWATTTSANVATNSIGILDITSGSTLATGLANDGAESLNIGTKTNTSPTTWTWQVTGCSTQDTSFTRNVCKCSIYPYFYGKVTSGTRPAVDNALVNGGTKVVGAVGSSVSVNFASSSQWTWFAIPESCAPRTKWFVAVGNCGDINNAPVDKYPDECELNITDSGGCWSTVCYKVYMSGLAFTDAAPIAFRTY